MSTMIPPFIRKANVSNAEKKVFNLLKNIDINCTVLHSLGIVDHAEKVFGEIDFVVITEEGILCLEVKGGQVSREDGVWYFMNKYGEENSKSEGPFQQAVGAMFSLREYIKKNFPYNSQPYKCQFACGVIFPDIIFNNNGPDIIPEIIFDARNYDNEMEQYVHNVFKYWKNECSDKHGFTGCGLTKENIRRLEVFLRGNFKSIPSLDNILNELDEEILTATNEQYSKLEMVEENQHIIIKGGAGTGKTFIGMEHAKQKAAVNKNVLYLCFNRMLAEYLDEGVTNRYGEISSNLTIATLHSMLLKYVPYEEKIKYKEEKNYFNEILPELFMNLVHSGKEIERYDEIIIDEGQDLLTENYLMCIDEFLNDGLDAGKWCIFYDDNQNIYNKDFKDILKVLDMYNPTKVTLNTNCRNTKQIGVYNTLFTGIKHEKYLKVDGYDVGTFEYTCKSEQNQEVVRLVKQLISEGINPGDIVILSPYKFQNSSLAGMNILRSVCKFQDITGCSFRNIQNDCVKFSTIHSFKGLESRSIILIDVDKLDNDDRKLLNYTAMSRAKSLLHICYDKNVKVELEKLMLKGYDLLAVK